MTRLISHWALWATSWKISYHSDPELPNTESYRTLYLKLFYTMLFKPRQRNQKQLMGVWLFLVHHSIIPTLPISCFFTQELDKTFTEFYLRSYLWHFGEHFVESEKSCFLCRKNSNYLFGFLDIKLSKMSQENVRA